MRLCGVSEAERPLLRAGEREEIRHRERLVAPVFVVGVGEVDGIALANDRDGCRNSLAVHVAVGGHHQRPVVVDTRNRSLGRIDREIMRRIRVRGRRPVGDARAAPHAAFGKPVDSCDPGPAFRTFGGVDRHGVPVVLERRVTRRGGHRRAAEIDIVQRLAVAERISSEGSDAAHHRHRPQRRAVVERLIPDAHGLRRQHKVRHGGTVRKRLFADRPHVCPDVNAPGQSA